MLVICLLFLLNRLVILEDASCKIQILLLCSRGILQHVSHCMLMFCISFTELAAHRLVEVCRIIRIIRLRILKLCKCPSKILELCLEGKIHFLEEGIQDFSDCIFLALGNRIHQYIQRIVHLLEGRGDDLFKTARHLYRKFLCHLFHSCCLVLLACNQNVHRLALSGRHNICMETVQKSLEAGCQKRIL